jgi:signal transduction histidine kinase
LKKYSEFLFDILPRLILEFQARAEFGDEFHSFVKACGMNWLLPNAAPESENGTREAPTRSAPALVYALMANFAARPLGFEDWLGEIGKALGARLAALVAFLDDEPVVQCFFSAERGPEENVNWPWAPNRLTFREFLQASPAVPRISADGRSSVLTTVVSSEGLFWVFSLEDVSTRIWSLDECAALTLAATALFQVASIPEGSTSWAQWSERAQTQKRLEDITAAVGRLIHDFNNVLTSVLGFSELSLSQLPAGTPEHSFIVEVYKAAQQGNQLLQQLSLFSTRKAAAAGSTTTLSILVAEEEKRFRKAWGEAVALEVRVPPDLPHLAIDVDSLRVLLDKLLNNAREAIRDTGSVLLSARPVHLTRADCLGLLGRACPGSSIEITVADSGDGLSAEARRRMFAPFFTTKPGHRGLGLAAVYGILKNCGGGICLEQGPEKGTRARVYVPTVAARDGDRTREDGMLSSPLCLATQGETRGKSSNS